MKITIITVGKIKESYFAEAVKEYSKRLSRYCKLEMKEVADEKTPDGAGPAIEQQIKKKEGSRILAHLKDDAYVIALAITGKEINSEELAAKIHLLGVTGTSHIIFMIGGSLGLDEEVLRFADLQLSFSAMTFPHPLMRVILLEQIYRSYRIIHHQPYHK